MLTPLLTAFIFPPAPPPIVAANVRAMTLTRASQAFRQNSEIPAQHTCQGADVSPPLAWSGVPANAKNLAPIADDPDAPDPAAPKITWMLYNIPPTAARLPEGREATPKHFLKWMSTSSGTRYIVPMPSASPLNGCVVK